MRAISHPIIESLEDHPDLPLILGVLGRITDITDPKMYALAELWKNYPALAQVRNIALSPDSPLILEVLSSFDALAALYADDIEGAKSYLTVDPATTLLALKAVRDAIAGAYAKPILPPGTHEMLMRPWNLAMGTGPENPTGPDLGPMQPFIQRVVEAASDLDTRCHDNRSLRVFEELSALAVAGESEREQARADAWDDAITTGRRRTWVLLRRTVNQQVNRNCRECGGARLEDRDAQRVADVIADGACAFLVHDVVADETMSLLTYALAVLIPMQRGSEE